MFYHELSNRQTKEMRILFEKLSYILGENNGIKIVSVEGGRQRYRLEYFGIGVFDFHNTINY